MVESSTTAYTGATGMGGSSFRTFVIEERGVRVYSGVMVFNWFFIFWISCLRSFWNCPVKKKVVSFSLFGNSSRYLSGALPNLLLAQSLYSGWEVRFYSDFTVPTLVLDGIRKQGGKVVIVPRLRGVAGMFTRFLVAEDPCVERFIVRDVDSRIGMREWFAVHEWVASRKPIHIMRDAPYHDFPMLGGMWGGFHISLNISNHLRVNKTGKWNEDQEFLWETVYRTYRDNHIAHDSYFCTKYPNSVSFPTERRHCRFVGEIYSGSTTRMTKKSRCFSTHSPVQCRRNISWMYG